MNSIIFVTFLLGKVLSEERFYPPKEDLPGFQGEEVNSQSHEYFCRVHTIFSYIFSGLVINLQINKSINKNGPVSLHLEPQNYVISACF